MIKPLDLSFAVWEKRRWTKRHFERPVRIFMDVFEAEAVDQGIDWPLHETERLLPRFPRDHEKPQWSVQLARAIITGGTTVDKVHHIEMLEVIVVGGKKLR